MTQTLKTGEIRLANLNPGKGCEPSKTRPVLILQNQALLDVAHPSTLIIPLTTNLIDAAEPLRIRITARDHLEKDSDLLIDQLRSIDNKRLIGEPLTSLNPTQLEKTYLAIADVIGMSEFIV